MAEFDTVIRGGMVVDGQRLPRYRADVGIKDGRIQKLGKLASHQAAKTIDAGGLIVAPGFVDLHTHYDAQLFWDPYCSISGWHGVTSAVIGNCGFGFAPVKPEMRERAMLTMTRVEAIPYESMKAGLPWDWVTFPEFLNSVERQPKGINLLPYVPLAPILIWVMGLEEAKKGRKPTPKEEVEICRLLNESMDAGGCGWSAQRLGPNSVQMDYDGTPMVTDIMADEIALSLSRVLGERNEGFVQMTYLSGTDAEGAKRVEAHYEQMARLSGRPILYNAVQANDRDPERHRTLMRWLEKCRSEGLRIYGQALSYDAGFTFAFKDNWSLWDDSPAWKDATIGSLEDKLIKLSDPERRPALRAHLSGIVTTSYDDIFIISVNRPNLKHLENLTLREVADKEGKNRHPVDVMLDLAVADELKTEFYTPCPNRRIDLLAEVI